MLNGKCVAMSRSHVRRRFIDLLKVLALTAATMIAVPSCSEASPPKGLTPFDPNSRPALGQSSVDNIGRRVAGLPAGRPVREISLYDFDTKTVVRFVDPEAKADYSNERLALSRDGRTIFAVRNYLDIGRYPDLVAIDIEAGTIMKLDSPAAGYWSLASGSTGRYLFYFRDISDQLKSLDGNPEGILDHRLDHSAPGPFRQLARYDLQLMQEELHSKIIFEDAALLTATSHRLIFSAKNAFPDFVAENIATKQSEAFRKFNNYPMHPESVSNPIGIIHHNLDLYRTLLPISPQKAATIVRVSRLQSIDFGLSSTMADPGEFDAGRLQLSDDEQVLFGTVRSGEYCWGVRLLKGAITCRRFDGDPTVNLRITMSFNGATTILSKTAAVRAGGVTWCRLSSGASINSCDWEFDSNFKQKFVTLTQQTNIVPIWKDK